MKSRPMSELQDVIRLASQGPRTQTHMVWDKEGRFGWPAFQDGNVLRSMADAHPLSTQSSLTGQWSGYVDSAPASKYRPGKYDHIVGKGPAMRVQLKHGPCY